MSELYVLVSNNQHDSREAGSFSTVPEVSRCWKWTG
jgi:hypothetical protein